MRYGNLTVVETDEILARIEELERKNRILEKWIDDTIKKIRNDLPVRGLPKEYWEK